LPGSSWPDPTTGGSLELKTHVSPPGDTAWISEGFGKERFLAADEGDKQGYSSEFGAVCLGPTDELAQDA
jgi:hypothetical protein